MTIHHKNSNVQPGDPKHSVAYYDREVATPGEVGGAFVIHFKANAKKRVDRLAKGDVIVLHQVIRGQRRTITHVVEVAGPAAMNVGGDFPVSQPVHGLARLQSAAFKGAYAGAHHMIIAHEPPVRAPAFADIAWRPAGGAVAPDFIVVGGRPYDLYDGVAVDASALIRRVVHSGLYDLAPNAAALITAASVQGLNQ